ncbi:MAG: hypothetical protein FVQ83_16070 [Chloroflexi bacterium]|nr:hypothetical protein [Chloroflexota bacterium]
MRIDSRLMKTDMQLDSIERYDEHILMQAPPDDWNETKVYLSPEDVINTIRLSLHRGMISYLLMFPFILISQYLKGEKDINEYIHQISYGVAAFFMGLLLLGGTTFLLEEPISGTLALVVLAVLFYLIAALSSRSGFLYLAVPITVIAYFLFGIGQGLEVGDFPKLAIGVVLTLLILGNALGNQREGKLAQPLYHAGYLVIIIFTLYIAFNASTYAVNDPWGASLPLLVFTYFLFVRYFETQEVFLHYAAVLFLGSGFLLVLYGLPFLPVAYYGLPLIALSMAMILIADRYHEEHGLEHVAPAYSAGILIALLAFVYARQDISALLLSLALFSVHFFGGTGSLGIKTTIENWGEKTFQWIEFTLANLAAGYCALLMFTSGRTNWAAIPAAIVYVYFYRKMGIGREPTILQTRNQYFWAAGGFYALLIFIVLGFLDPFGDTQKDMLLVPVLLIPLMIYGRSHQKQNQNGLAASVYESSLLTVVVALIFPALLGEFHAQTAALVAGLFLALYALLGVLWKDEVIYYALPIISAHLYYDGLVIAGLSGSVIGLLFLPVGLLAMLYALYLQRRGTGPARTLFMTWFVFSGVSIFTAASDRTLTVYLISVWAGLYLLAASFVKPSEDHQPVVEAGENV